MRKRIEQLHSYVYDLEKIQDEQEDHSKHASKIKEDHIKNPTNTTSAAYAVLDTIEQSKMFFKEQIDIIKKISPLMSEYLDYLMEEFEAFQFDINYELQDSTTTLQQNHPDAIKKMQTVDVLIEEIADCYNQLHHTLIISHDSFGGMLNFIENITPKKTKQKPTKQRKKNVK